MGGGVRFREFIEALAAKGYAALTGDCPTVGASSVAAGWCFAESSLSSQVSLLAQLPLHLKASAADWLLGPPAYSPLAGISGFSLGGGWGKLTKSKGACWCSPSITCGNALPEAAMACILLPSGALGARAHHRCPACTVRLPLHVMCPGNPSCHVLLSFVHRPGC